MAKVEVSFNLDVPGNIKPEDIAEWVAYEVGYRGGLKLSNPLADTELSSMDIKDFQVHIEK